MLQNIADLKDGPPLEQKLMGIITGADGQNFALIGGQVYGAGEFIGDDPNYCWQVSQIEPNAVILGFGQIQRVIALESESNLVDDANQAGEINNQK